MVKYFKNIGTIVIIIIMIFRLSNSTCWRYVNQTTTFDEIYGVDYSPDGSYLAVC